MVTAGVYLIARTYPIFEQARTIEFFRDVHLRRGGNCVLRFGGRIVFQFEFIQSTTTIPVRRQRRWQPLNETQSRNALYRQPTYKNSDCAARQFEVGEH